MDKTSEIQKLKLETFKERLKKREIWINGNIDDSLVETLYANLIKLQEENAQLPINIVINSNGGLLHESVVGTDIMGTISCPVKTIALANANSGGFILYMGGTERICHDYTCFMMHASSFAIANKVSNIKDRVEHSEYILEKLANFLTFQTGGKTTKEYWQKLFKSEKDKWFTIEEALKLGIVHKVIKRPSSINFKEREPHLWNLNV